MKRLGIAIIAIVLGTPISGYSAGLPWYAGADAGVSSLRPETENSPFTLDSGVSFGAGAFVGYDLSKRFSLELGYNYLGAATLSGNAGKTDIGYSALSAGALLYLYGNPSDIEERNGFAGYLRFGLSVMDNSASIPLEREDNVALLAGVGVEWPFSRQLSLRAELTSFDGDAQSARAAVIYRPRSDYRGTTVARAPQAPRAPEVRPQPKPQKPAPESTPAITTRPATPAPPAAPTQRATAPSSCIGPVAGEPSDSRGCALFSGKLRGVEFNSGTATLTPVAMQVLDRLVQNLQRYPSIAIEIQAHTESFGSEARAREIARQRTLSVARHLAGRGVSVQRMKARAFGHSQPVAEDTTIAGRRQNNRIELRVIR